MNLIQVVGTHYHVIDTYTGYIVATYVSLKTARARADKLDAEYGLMRYLVRSQTRKDSL